MVRRQSDVSGAASSDPPDAARDVAPEQVLGELARRWRGAGAMEYRSQAAMHHAYEFNLNVQIHVWLRRPSLARLVFRTSDYPEADRLRVCNGVRVYDRPFGHPGDTNRTVSTPLLHPGAVTENIPHPLDEAGYSVSQFFSPTPFVPPSYWNAQPGTMTTKARRLKQRGKDGKPRDVYEVVFKKGVAQDTLTLDVLSYCPILLVRVGDHGGRVQELLRETFLDVRLDPLLPDVLFRWSDRDNAGYSETTR